MALTLSFNWMPSKGIMLPLQFSTWLPALPDLINLITSVLSNIQKFHTFDAYLIPYKNNGSVLKSMDDADGRDTWLQITFFKSNVMPMKIHLSFFWTVFRWSIGPKQQPQQYLQRLDADIRNPNAENFSLKCYKSNCQLSGILPKIEKTFFAETTGWGWRWIPFNERLDYTWTSVTWYPPTEAISVCWYMLKLTEEDHLIAKGMHWANSAKIVCAKKTKIWCAVTSSR